MERKIFLTIFVFLLVSVSLFSSVYAIEKTGEYQGSFDVDVGEVGIVIGPQPQPICQEDWTCSYWNGCSGGSQTFMCVDCKHCGTFNLKPINCGKTQTCGTNGGSDSSGGGSGGGDGSSSSSSSSTTTYSGTCVENWKCTNWSNDNLCGTRTCTDKNKCGTVKLKPAEELECELVLRGLKTNKNFFSGITGAVIGVVGTPAGIGVLVFLIAIVAIYIYVAVMRRKQTSR